jgi:hypothetical protein
MAIELGKPMNFEALGDGTCTCGAKVKFGYTDGHPTAMHPMPQCETFLRFESPIDYIKHVNSLLDAEEPMLVKYEPCEACAEILRRILARSGEEAMCAAVGPTIECCPRCRNQIPKRPGKLVTRLKRVH